MGTPEFSVPFLERLYYSGYDIQGVVTQPDRKKGRGKKLQPPPVKEKALDFNLLVEQPSCSEDLLSLQSLKEIPDLIVTAAYGMFLPQWLLDYPVYNAINVHASLLPEYRGAAPIQRAIMDGKEYTGVTIMQMSVKMDAGDILNWERIEITHKDTGGGVYSKILQTGPNLLIDTIEKLRRGEITPVPQDENKASYAPKLDKRDEQLNFHKLTAEQVYNRVRALNPWPGAFAYWDTCRLKIWQVKVIDQTEQLELPEGEPGEIVNLACDGPIIKCQKGWVILTEVQPSGKCVMTGEEFLCGYILEKGNCLE